MEDALDLNPGSPSAQDRIGRAVAATVALAAIIALMQVDRFDPTGVRGGHVGAAITVAWCLGLAIWLLGTVRRRRSRITVRTLAALMAVVAAYFGLVRAAGPSFATLVAAGLLSAAMLTAALAPSPTVANPFRNRSSRWIMLFGGLWMLAHVCRIFGHASLISVGVIAPPI